MGREIELKLELAPDELDRLRRSRSLARLAVKPAQTQLLHSTYFDTDGLALFRKGLALRVRRQGRERIQSLKTTSLSSAPAADRIELEEPLPPRAAAPDPDLVRDRNLKHKLKKLVAGQGLKPLFETNVRRTTRLI